METIKLSKNPLFYQIAIPLSICLFGSLLIKALVDKDLFEAIIKVLWLILPFMFFSFIKAKMVVYDDDYITVSSIFKKEKIPVENIKEVSVLGRGNRMRVLVELKETSLFGVSFTFIPKKELKIPTDKSVGIQIAPRIIATKY